MNREGCKYSCTTAKYRYLDFLGKIRQLRIRRDHYVFVSKIEGWLCTFAEEIETAWEELDLFQKLLDVVERSKADSKILESMCHYSKEFITQNSDLGCPWSARGSTRMFGLVGFPRRVLRKA